MTIDRDKLAEAVAGFLEGLGQPFDPADVGATPERVARAWADELVCGYATDPDALVSWSPAPPDAGVVLVRDVRFASVCIHHLLPFFGVAHVAYLPDRRLAGLSKIGRVVEALARRLQMQERLTGEIAATLTRSLEPRGTLVVLEAEHTCMTLRGSRKESSRMVTVQATGCYREDDGARREVLDLLAPAGPSR